MGASTPTPRLPSLSETDLAAGELGDVPAAVLCANCGSPECAGCDRPSGHSGVLSIVPWERRSGSAVARLWATARATALSPDEFFSLLPPGRWLPALGFAVLAEGIAVTGLSLTLFALACAVLPELVTALRVDQVLRWQLSRGLAVGLPGLTSIMVLLHVAHGLSLDAAAWRHGSRQPGRGLRAGLYSCGWDLVTLPLGLLLLTLWDGPRAAWRAAPRGLTAPRRASLAYLTGVHGLPLAKAERASQQAIVRVSLPLLSACVGGLLAAAYVALR